MALQRLISKRMTMHMASVKYPSILAAQHDQQANFLHITSNSNKNYRKSKNNNYNIYNYNDSNSSNDNYNSNNMYNNYDNYEMDNSCNNYNNHYDKLNYNNNNNNNENYTDSNRRARKKYDSDYKQDDNVSGEKYYNNSRYLNNEGKYSNKQKSFRTRDNDYGNEEQRQQQQQQDHNPKQEQFNQHKLRLQLRIEEDKKQRLLQEQRLLQLPKNLQYEWYERRKNTQTAERLEAKVTDLEENERIDRIPVVRQMLKLLKGKAQKAFNVIDAASKIAHFHSQGCTHASEAVDEIVVDLLRCERYEDARKLIDLLKTKEVPMMQTYPTLMLVICGDEHCGFKSAHIDYVRNELNSLQILMNEKLNFPERFQDYYKRLWLVSVLGDRGTSQICFRYIETGGSFGYNSTVYVLLIEALCKEAKRSGEWTKWPMVLKCFNNLLVHPNHFSSKLQPETVNEFIAYSVKCSVYREAREALQEMFDEEEIQNYL